MIRDGFVLKLLLKGEKSFAVHFFGKPRLLCSLVQLASSIQINFIVTRCLSCGVNELSL